MPEKKMDAGLFLLGTTGAFGLWSAMNTSPTGLYKFVAKDGDTGTERVARDAMLVSLGLVGALSLGIFLLYGKKSWPAALGTAATGVGLYVYYDWLLKHGVNSPRYASAERKSTNSVSPMWLPYPVGDSTRTYPLENRGTAGPGKSFVSNLDRWTPHPYVPEDGEEESPYYNKFLVMGTYPLTRKRDRYHDIR